VAAAGSGQHAIQQIVGSYKSWIVRIYCRIRFIILRQPFLEEIDQYLPRQGQVLDLGCGFGLFSLYFSKMAPERALTGVDLNARRIATARESATSLGCNVDYQVSDAVTWDSTITFDAIYMLDLIHHLPANEVDRFLAAVSRRLRPGGLLLVKDVAPTPRYKMWFTLILDRLMVGSEPIRYWPPAELSQVLERLGFEVRRHRMTDILPYPHILYVCRLR
jgi:2-polyprenyl-6-hydroxyphenyl methylase/3-demethylubiquinone-9 3-methyltransferase